MGRWLGLERELELWHVESWPQVTPPPAIFASAPSDPWTEPDVDGWPIAWASYHRNVARYPTMRTPDWRWQVEVITTRGGQSFRVKRLDRLPAPGSTGLPSPGTLVNTIGEVRALLGDDFDRLVEVRGRRFDGGR